jgi:ubiquinone/menaquinone biosynthesis C-methylase UbiE
VLTKDQIRTIYDRIGSKQDTQAFYEDPATSALAGHSHLQQAKAVFEFGVGTGRFAENLLRNYLAPDCKYFGIDVSPAMIEIAGNRLRPWGDRASVHLSDGAVHLSVPDGAFDRFISNYVLDLLDESDTATLIDEAHRILSPEGLLCLVSLTYGKTFPAQWISSTWEFIYRHQPKLVGGCRPIDLSKYISDSRWHTEYRHTVTAFGVSSEVLIAKRLP